MRCAPYRIRYFQNCNKVKLLRFKKSNRLPSSPHLVNAAPFFSFPPKWSGNTARIQRQPRQSTCCNACSLFHLAAQSDRPPFDRPSPAPTFYSCFRKPTFRFFSTRKTDSLVIKSVKCYSRVCCCCLYFIYQNGPCSPNIGSDRVKGKISF